MRRDEERIFNENLDRLLTGGDTAIDAGREEDLRTALEFARQMADLRPAPSTQFQANLKARLLQKLNEQETWKEAKRGWWWRLIPTEPIWQAVTILAIVIIAGGVLWGTVFRPSPSNNMVSVPQPSITNNIFAPDTSAPAVAGVPATTTNSQLIANQILRADASTDKSQYKADEVVDITVTWQNVTSQTITIQEFPPIASLMQSSTRQPVYTFSAGKTSKTLAPGEKAQYVLSWSQIDSQGRRVAPGSYYLELEEMYYQGHEVPMDLTSPVSFDILN